MKMLGNNNKFNETSAEKKPTPTAQSSANGSNSNLRAGAGAVKQNANAGSSATTQNAGVKPTTNAPATNATQGGGQKYKIRAPYRFVSLNSRVFYPQDYGAAADGAISFDKPFAGAVSGEIELKITFKSDFFVGAATAKKSKNEQNAAQNAAQNSAASASNSNLAQNKSQNKPQPAADKPFFTLNGEPALPGSSVRGTFRTIAEVLSFARLQTQDKRLSYRDLNNDDYLNKIRSKSKDGNKDGDGKIYAGFLRRKNGEYFIDNHGKIGGATKWRIRYTPSEKHPLEKNAISVLFGEGVAEQFTRINPRNEKQVVLSALQKYAIIPLERCRTEQGTLVFTGTAPQKDKPKTREFLFPNKCECEGMPVSADVAESFELAYGIGLREAPYKSEIYEKLFKGVLDSGGKVPVFFALDERGAVSSFGFSHLYKFPYANKTGDILAKNQPANAGRLDMVERVFGFVEDGGRTRGQAALRSRVSFSHFALAAASKNIPRPEPKSLVLGAPRVTFYPFYLEQGAGAKFKTFDNADARLAGFKFYPPRATGLWAGNPTNGNENIESRIHPLAAGCEFSGKMRFFNLTRAELGLLLRAVSVFDGESEFFKFGGAKPYGYGDAAVEIVSLRAEELSGERVAFAGGSAEFGEFKTSCEAEFVGLLKGAGLDVGARENELKALARKGVGGENDAGLNYLALKEFGNIKSENYNKFSGKKSGDASQQSGAKAGGAATRTGSRPVASGRRDNTGGGWGSKWDDRYGSLRSQDDDDY